MALVTGTLKGFDALMNLVLDDVSETMRGRSLQRMTGILAPHVD